MPRFAANVSMMFQEHPFLDRFAAAAAAGFEAVELLFPYAEAVEEIGPRREAAGITQALFNLPPGDWDAGERGVACLPGREEEVTAGVTRALTYAAALGCRTVHCMAGLMPAGVDRAELEHVYVGNLRQAARSCAAAGVTLVIEPINSRDMPGYFLARQADARRLIETVAEPNLKLQLDLYHCQIMEGDLARHIRELAPITGHVQIAGVPDRHEPDIGEVSFPYLLELLDDVGYEGWVGCEYRPRGRTEDGLGWLRSWRAQSEVLR